MGLNVSIREDLAKFIARKIESGEYGSAEEVVEEALSMLEVAHQSDEERLEWLRAAFDEGVASGDAGEIDFEELKREARRCSGLS